MSDRGGRIEGRDVSERSVVLFDFDGTLADSMPGIIATAREVLTARGWDDERIGDLKRIVGPPFPVAWSQIYGVSAAEAEEITEAYRAIYSRRDPLSSPLYPGVPELLEALRARGKRLGICSSKRLGLVRTMLDAHGVLDAFEEVVAQQDARHADKPWLVAESLRRFGAGPDDAVMVGDRNYDVAGAAEAGVPCVGVLFGTAEREELEQAGAACIVDSVDALRAVLLGEQR